MSKSLQDQLLSLGLAKKKPAGKERDTVRKTSAAKHQPGRRGSGNTAEVSLDKAYALREREEQRKADQARRKKQAEDRKRREINNEIRKIVEQYRLNSDKAEIPRNFMFRGRIRKLYVTPEQQQALHTGELGIAYLSGGYHLLAPEHLEAVRKISGDHIADLHAGDDNEDDHPVPDDLVW